METWNSTLVYKLKTKEQHLTSKVDVSEMKTNASLLFSFEDYKREMQSGHSMDKLMLIKVIIILFYSF